MAEDKEKEAELSDDEAAELENLLEDAEDANVSEAGLKGKLQKILGNKKLLIIIGLVVIFLMIGISFLLLRDVDEKVVAPIEEQLVEEEVKEKVIIETVNIILGEPSNNNYCPALD